MQRHSTSGPRPSAPLAAGSALIPFHREGVGAARQLHEPRVADARLFPARACRELKPRGGLEFSGQRWQAVRVAGEGKGEGEGEGEGSGEGAGGGGLRDGVWVCGSGG